MNDSRAVNLTGLLQTLQVTDGASQEEIDGKADIGGNRPLGLEEALYFLRKNGEL
jgi:hypothetical protein